MIRLCWLHRQFFIALRNKVFFDAMLRRKYTLRSIALVLLEFLVYPEYPCVDLFQTNI